MLGCKLEELLSDGKEDEAWEGVRETMSELGEMMLGSCDGGPCVAGDRPSGTDFFIAGSMQTARVVDEGVFERMVGVRGFREVYEGCLGYMGRVD
jgi:hypothetical protein